MQDYWKNITALKEKQTEKGLKEYGQVLEENQSIPTLSRITMIEEEMVDALMYLEHLKYNIEEVKEKICDDYCHFPMMINDSELLGAKCHTCPLNRL